MARVVVDVPLAHLDRPFDYAVPEDLLPLAAPGCRVRVPFAGRTVGGFVLSREATSGHAGRLARLARVVSPEPVLSPEVADLCRAVADRWVGTMSDVLRLAVPPRLARVEKESPPAAPSAPGPSAPGSSAPGSGTGWDLYSSGPDLLGALSRDHGHPRAVWTALPGEDWPKRLAEVAAAAAAGGRGSVLVVPDHRDAAALDAALTATLGPGRHVTLTAALGPTERYRRFLAVRRGAVRVVAGTRAAAWAPVADLGLVAIWDDGDDLHCEPHAPYPHTRDVMLLRAHLARAAALVGGFARTAEAQRLVVRGWASAVAAPRDVVRARAPRVVASSDDHALARDPLGAAARLPHVAFEAARASLGAGRPVLVQVPRRGYVPVLACAGCRRPARCATCHGPLGLPGAGQPPRCSWCGRQAVPWSCPHCTATGLRSTVVGAARTSEELGRAFPGVRVVTSGAGDIADEIGEGPCLVVATTGAEPPAVAGYGALLLLDAWIPLSAPGLRAGEEAVRRWLAAAALVRPAREGGTVVVTGDPALRPVAALVRWDPAWFAARELDERAELGFPPVTALVSVTGRGSDVADVLDAVAPVGATVLGPLPAREPGEERALLSVALDRLPVLADALRTVQAARSVRKTGSHVRVQLDPYQVG